MTNALTLLLFELFFSFNRGEGEFVLVSARANCGRSKLVASSRFMAKKKRKVKMTSATLGEEIRVSNMTLRDLETCNQENHSHNEEFTAYLVQQIIDLQRQLQHTKELAKVVVTTNTLPEATKQLPSLIPSYISNHFDTYNARPMISIPNPPVVGLTTTNQSRADPFYIIPLPLNQYHISNTSLYQNSMPIYQTLSPNRRNIIS